MTEDNTDKDVTPTESVTKSEEPETVDSHAPQIKEVDSESPVPKKKAKKKTTRKRTTKKKSTTVRKSTAKKKTAKEPSSSKVDYYNLIKEAVPIANHREIQNAVDAIRKGKTVGVSYTRGIRIVSGRRIDEGGRAAAVRSGFNDLILGQ